MIKLCSTKLALTKLNSLFIEFDTLTKHIENNEDSMIDFRKIGVTYKSRKLNLSQVMYNTAESKHGGQKGKNILVDESSYDYKRRFILDAIIISNHNMINRNLSVSHIFEFIGFQIQFIDWLRMEEINFPKNVQQAKEVFLAYKKNLQSLRKMGSIVSSVAHGKHKASLDLLQYIFQDKNNEIASIGIIMQTKNRGNAFANQAKKKTTNEINYAFIFYWHFFDQVADFILEGKPYPHNVKLPRGNAVLVPTPKSNVGVDYKIINKAFECIDYRDGHIKTDKEFVEMTRHLNKKKQRTRFHTLRHGREVLLDRLSIANGDLTCNYRLELGNRAMKAYFMILLMVTTLNDSILGNIRWGIDDFTTTKASQEFRGIKPRAKNKKVLFKILKHFIPSFKKFLKLRRFVLNGLNCDYLFFNMSHKQILVTSNQLDGKYAKTIWRQSFSPLDDKLPNAFSRDFRKDAALDAIRLKGPKAAVALLQNSLNILGDHYDGQSAESKAHEINELLTHLNGDIVTKERGNTEVNGLVGECDHETREATHYVESCEISPDCGDPKTCIFCKWFRTHPEAEEIRKLYSLEYIIKEISPLRAKSQEHYNTTMEPWLIRIKALLKRMIELNPECNNLMKTIKVEVYKEQLLTPYWTQLLEHFEIMEILR